jgi:hypothetical protein
MAPSTYAEHLHHQINGSQLQFIPDTGHMVMLEKRDEVNRNIENCLLMHGLRAISRDLDVDVGCGPDRPPPWGDLSLRCREGGARLGLRRILLILPPSARTPRRRLLTCSPATRPHWNSSHVRCPGARSSLDAYRCSLGIQSLIRFVGPLPPRCSMMGDMVSRIDDVKAGSQEWPHIPEPYRERRCLIMTW